MELTRIRALRGPNLWGRHTALEALVKCEENEKIITNISGFETRLRIRSIFCITTTQRMGRVDG